MDLYKNNGYIKTGFFRGFCYVIAVRNGIPCCYVEIPESLRILLGNNPDTIAVHGGITFAGTLATHKGYWIGWDYGHPDDYIPGVQSGIQWSEDDLVGHCESAIMQLGRL